MSLNTTAHTWATSEVVTAALLNLELRDAVNGIQAAWTAYTPTLTNITLGNGTLVCKFTRWGKTVRARGLFTAGSTTTFAAGALGFSLPVTPHGDYNGLYAVGTGVVQPVAAGTRIGAQAVINTTAGTFLGFLANTGAANAQVTNLVPGTFTASNALISWDIAYEAA